jgi:signal-transduction protein with cAMP-binding, CBS, and nucleotidyltransferase domain
MTLSEKMFALKSVAPFDTLRDGELALIAQEARVREFGPNEVVCGAEKPIRSLHVAVAGQVLRQGDSAVIPIAGVTALLFNQETNEMLIAGPEGATCLLIRRGNFFTIANECPNLLVGLLGPANQGVLI